MDIVSGGIIGFFFGFGLGVGCALAVMYSIYTGGYRKAIEDSLLEGTSDRYRKTLPLIEKKMAKDRERAAK